MTDQDLMPFGKHKGEKMENVPAAYLLWLREQHCSSQRVCAYIEENLAALMMECPDYINEEKHPRRDDYEFDLRNSITKD
jgi:uncharacterized protein (DUF3820 family)